MSGDEARWVTLSADSGEPASALLARLSPAEQDLLARLPTERQRRQSALARVAGKRAIRQALGSPPRDFKVEILQASNGEPIASVDGDTAIVSISLAHSGHLAAAFAWMGNPASGYCAGIDLERVRPTQIAASSYAFSGRERRLIAEGMHGRDWSALAAWTAKEAAWKALRPEVDCGPDTIEIQRLNLRRGYALLKPRGKLLQRFGQVEIRTRLINVIGPDGDYVLSFAELAARRAPKILVKLV
jgi:4'-phosphopantetheinyl transferase EntD